jgi:hypothetical protein
MKHELIIIFESEDRNINECMVYSESLPPRDDVCTEDELLKSGLKRMVKIKPEKKQNINGKIGCRYIFRITDELLKILEEYKKSNKQ